jgi:hypothetical protein
VSVHGRIITDEYGDDSDRLNVSALCPNGITPRSKQANLRDLYGVHAYHRPGRNAGHRHRHLATESLPEREHRGAAPPLPPH